MTLCLWIGNGSCCPVPASHTVCGPFAKREESLAWVSSPGRHRDPAAIATESFRGTARPACGPLRCRARAASDLHCGRGRALTVRVRRAAAALPPGSPGEVHSTCPARSRLIRYDTATRLDPLPGRRCDDELRDGRVPPVSRLRAGTQPEGHLWQLRRARTGTRAAVTANCARTPERCPGSSRLPPACCVRSRCRARTVVVGTGSIRTPSVAASSIRPAIAPRGCGDEPTRPTESARTSSRARCASGVPNTRSSAPGRPGSVQPCSTILRKLQLAILPGVIRSHACRSSYGM
jgi:hypothetical protein